MIIIHNEKYPVREFPSDYFELVEDGQYASGQIAKIGEILVPLEPGDEVEAVKLPTGTVSKGDN